MEGFLTTSIESDVSPSHGDEGTVLSLFKRGRNNSRETILVEPIRSDNEPVYISPDEKFAALNSADGVFRLQHLRAAELMERLCRQVTHNLSATDWRRFFAKESYRTTCTNLPWD